jgi:ribonuclease Y
MEQILGLLIPGVVVAAVFLAGLLVGRKIVKQPAAPEEILVDARMEAQRILTRADEEARAKAETYRDREEATMEHRRVEVVSKEDRISQQAATLEQRSANLAQREELVIEKERTVARQMVEAAETKGEALLELESIAGFDSKAAKSRLLEKVEDDAKRDAMVMVRDMETRAREEGERRSRRILATVIQRVASDVASETTISSVALPSDDMKGRIIGRDGRNIRSFEAITGVDLIVDDTPESVSVSTFDPVRREVARLALERLVEDGRIHPTSIEEAYEKAKDEVEQSIRDAGEWAMLEVGLTRMHPELITLVGRLRYRTSYGQNVLDHLVEAGHIAGMLAAELGVDEVEVRRAAFLHDIGKAVSHEVGGSHALIGAEIARRFGEDPAIVHAIESHHNEVEPRTLTAVLVQAADAVSASRPGARREALDSYVRRLERLEEIAEGFPGVEKVFALQAGREVRVVVDPGSLDDLGSKDLARSIARKLEDDLQYPGQIEVTVIREYRAKDYAR